MARVFFDDDADLGVIVGSKIAVIGYGSQGRSQALNLRDSGLDVVVGNRSDGYQEQVMADGLELRSIAEASSLADVLMLILPDEVQPEVYAGEIAPNLRAGATISFASGYALHYETLTPAPSCDTIVVAPKMVGGAVRSRFVDGLGFASLVAVHHDASGHALDTALALAKAIGGTKHGAWESTVEEETVTDLFGEQVSGARLAMTILAFETLVDAGYDPEVTALELYASGTAGEVMAACARDGLLNNLAMHSPASQYGHLSRAPRLVPGKAKEALLSVLDDIRSGRFAEELEQVRHDDYRQIDDYIRQYSKHPLFASEAKIRAAAGGTDAGNAEPPGGASETV